MFTITEENPILVTMGFVFLIVGLNHLIDSTVDVIKCGFDGMTLIELIFGLFLAMMGLLFLMVGLGILIVV